MLRGRLGHGFWRTSWADCNLFNVEWLGWQWMEEHHIITARKRSLEQGNAFTCVCYSVHGEGVSVWCHFLSDCLVPCSFKGVSVSGSMFLPRGVCLWSHVHSKGVSVSGPMFPRGVSLTSLHIPPGQRPSPLGSVKSGRYASYWNAFLFHINLRSLLPLIVLLHVIFLSNLYRLYICVFLMSTCLYGWIFESRSKRKPCRIHNHISRPDS